VRDHTGIDPDPSILGTNLTEEYGKWSANTSHSVTHDQPFNPILRLADVTGFYEPPVLVQLLPSLQPVSGIGEKVRIIHGHNGRAHTAEESRKRLNPMLP